MADRTKIEWTDATVNAVNGCSVLSPGCKLCYAMKQAHRFDARRGLTRMTAGGMVWTGEVRLNEKQLLQPLAWKRARRIFWNAHGDLFHDSVPDEWIDKVFAVCALTPQHSHQILTKRSARMRAYMSAPDVVRRICTVAAQLRYVGAPNPERGINEFHRHMAGSAKLTAWAVKGGIASDMFFREQPNRSYPTWIDWPFPNVWLGVSVEDQQRADERIPDLLATPAAVRFISAEPLLGPVRLTNIDCSARADQPDFYWINALTGEHDDMCRPCAPVPSLDWVIVGGESGPGARPMHPDWAEQLRDQCHKAGVPFLFKQWGHWAPVSAIDAELIEACYFPAPANRPDASRRCKVDQCVLHRDGKRFDGCEMYEWGAFLQGTYAMTMMAVGKGRAGRLLGGVTHDGMPA
ncbi:phage Gp37/Gp68 family protein [Sphingomonas sp. UYP23]